jgi:hypothetical protein
MCCSTGCATRSPETSRLVAPRGVLWRNPTTPTTDGEANPQTTGWPSRADWYQSNAARSRLADFFQDTQNGPGIFSNQSSAGASSSGVPSIQPTPTNVPETGVPSLSYCSICLTQETTRLPGCAVLCPCGHAFHNTCIEQWLALISR